MGHWRWKVWLNSLSKKPRPEWPLNMMLRKRRRVHMKENCQKPAFGMQRLWNPALVVGARVLRHVHKEACSLYPFQGTPFHRSQADRGWHKTRTKIYICSN